MLNRLFRLTFLFLAVCRLLPAQTNNLPVTANMDTGTSTGRPQHVWYERGFNTIKPETGLPSAGIPFQSQSHSNHWYLLAPYTNLNALLITRASDSQGQFTLASAAAYSELSFLVSAGWGPVSLNVIVHHRDQTIQTNILRVDDWANSTNFAWIAHGRLDLATRRFDPIDTNYWRLYARQIALTNTTSPVTHIEFVRRPNQPLGNAAVFGVSGSTGHDFTPISVSGFNHDVVIEASYTAFTIPNLSGAMGGVSPVIDVGGPVTSLLAIRNDGNASSPSTTVAVYLRNSYTPNDDPLQVGEIDIPPLEPTGTNHLFTFNFTSPSGLGGLYDLIFRIDPDSEVTELVETDNQGSRQIGIGPNLLLSVRESALLTNELPWQVELEILVTSGAAAAAATRGSVFLGPRSGANATNGIRLGEFDVAALGVGADEPFPRQILNLSVPIPNDISPGSYFVVVQIDSEYQLPEISESDNFFSIRVEIPPQPVPMPSLEISSEIVVDEDGGPIRIPYKIAGFNLPAVNQTLSFPVTGHPFDPPSFEGSGADRTIVLPLKTNQNGQAVLEFYVGDGVSSVRKGIIIMVRPVNDAFTFGTIEDRILAAGARIPVPLQIEDPDTPPGLMEGTVLSTMPELFGEQGLKLEWVNGGLILVLASMTNRAETTQITVILTDGETTRQRMFSATFALPGLTLKSSAPGFGDVEITGASLVPATVAVSRDLSDWTTLQGVQSGHGFKLRRASVASEFFRLRPTE